MGYQGSDCGIAETNMHNMSKNASRPNLAVGDGSLSRGSSKRQPPTSGYGSRNASRQYRRFLPRDLVLILPLLPRIPGNDLTNGPKSRSRLNVGDALQGNGGSLPLQTQQDLREPRPDQKNQAELRTRGMNGAFHQTHRGTSPRY